MDTENESLPTEERTSIDQQTDAIAQVPPQTGNAPLVGQPLTPVPRIQRITRFLEDVRPTPGRMSRASMASAIASSLSHSRSSSLIFVSHPRA